VSPSKYDEYLSKKCGFLTEISIFIKFFGFLIKCSMFFIEICKFEGNLDFLPKIWISCQKIGFPVFTEIWISDNYFSHKFRFFSQMSIFLTDFTKSSIFTKNWFRQTYISPNCRYPLIVTFSNFFQILKKYG